MSVHSTNETDHMRVLCRQSLASHLHEQRTVMRTFQTHLDAVLSAGQCPGSTEHLDDDFSRQQPVQPSV